MMLDKLKKITDICIMVEDIERTVEFYTEKLDFKLRRRAEGFADFHTNGVTLAAWELDHIGKFAGVSNVRSPKEAHKACVAIELDAPAYFTDPDGTLWELYAWEEGGPGDYHGTNEVQAK